MQLLIHNGWYIHTRMHNLNHTERTIILINMTIPHENQPSYAPTVVHNASVVNYGAGDNSNDEQQQEVTFIPDSNVYAPIIVQEEPPTSTVNPAAETNFPPHNCPDGGQWGRLQYAGNRTCAMVCLGCLLGGPFGLCILACPQDEKDVYCVNGTRLYDAAGKYIGTTRNNAFIPSRRA